MLPRVLIETVRSVCPAGPAITLNTQTNKQTKNEIRERHIQLRSHFVGVVHAEDSMEREADTCADCHGRRHREKTPSRATHNAEGTEDNPSRLLAA